MRLRVWSRETGSVVLSCFSLLVLDNQAEYGAYSRDSSLDHSVRKADTDPDKVMSEIFQLLDELGDLYEVVSTECLITMILDVLPVEKYSTINFRLLETLI